MYKNILVPIASHHDRKIDEALRVAQTLCSDGGEITLMTVVDPIPSYVMHYLPENQEQTNIDEAAAVLKADAKGIENAKVEVVTGHAGSTITEYAAEKGIDLIVIASHRPEFQDWFLGSTAARVVRHAACAVHVVR